MQNTFKIILIIAAIVAGIYVAKTAGSSNKKNNDNDDINSEGDDTTTDTETNANENSYRPHEEAAVITGSTSQTRTDHDETNYNDNRVSSWEATGGTSSNNNGRRAIISRY